MKKLLAGICVLTLALLACNINKELTSPPQSQSAIATVVAQTMQAFESASPTAPTAPTVFDTPTQITPSPSATPMAVIKAITYCRSGPAETYTSITNLNPNQKAAVLGKDPTGDYWLIETTSGECWIAAQSVTITGNIQTIPELTPPPPTPTGVPARPGSLFYQYSCGISANVTTQLTWVAASADEAGFHIYRNGVLIATLPAGTTSYTDTTSISVGSTMIYSVTAYNSIGESAPRTQSFQCK
ncbi:MAG: hypothetical protein WCA79_00385 [Anaerolineales bacterium]